MSMRNAAIIAGIGYLLVFIISILGNVFALDKIIVTGEAVKTVNNIIANKSLFRFGTTCWLVVVVLDVIVAWALYMLFKPVNSNLSLLAAWLRLIFAAIFAYSFVDYFKILELFSGSDYLSVFDLGQLQAQSILLLKGHDFAMHLSFLFFGLHIFFIGYLILKSEYVPRWLGFLLMAASCGYMIDSFGNFLSVDYQNNHVAFLVFVAGPAFISEFSLTIWLLIKGRKLPHLLAQQIQIPTLP